MNSWARSASRAWIVWGLLLAVTVAGLVRYPWRPALPFEYRVGAEGLYIGRVTDASAVPGDWFPGSGSQLIRAVAGRPVRAYWHVRLLLAGTAPGDLIRVSVEERNGGGATEILERDVRLVSHGATSSWIVNLFVLGMVSLGTLGLAALLIKHGENPAAIPLAGMLAFMGSAVALDEAGLRLFAGAGRWLPGVLWALTYAMIGPFMVSFASVFPYRTALWRRFGWVRTLFWIVGILVGIGMAVGLVLQIEGLSAGAYRLTRIGQRGLWVLLLGSALLTALSLAVAYRGSADYEVRNRIRWILAGMVIGAAPPLLLLYLPKLLAADPLLSEQVALLFLLLVPVCLVISVVRHQMLDIKVAVRQGLMYAPASVLVALLFGGAAIAATYLLLNATLPAPLPPLTLRVGLIFALPILLFHLLYEPLRRRAQRFVARLFFRTKYSYGRTLRAFSEGLATRLTGLEVFDLMVATINETIEPEWIRFVDGTGRWRTYWSAVQEPDPALEPHARTSFRELQGLEVHLGPKRSGMAYHEYDRATLSSLAGLAGVSLRREILQRRLLQEEAERDRLEAEARLKEEFLSLVSHDLRSPLTAINLGAAVIARKEMAGEDESIREAALRIQRSSMRLSEMVERLLHTALADSDLLQPELRECDLGEVVGRVLERFRPLAESERVVLDCTLPDGAVVRADRGLLTEAIGNLVDNALKFAPPDSTVTISAGSEGTGWCISVRDEGPGVPEEHRAGLFDRKRVSRGREKEEKKGFGLGLYLVRRLMVLQGGSVELTKTGEDGSTFTLTLPG